MKRIYRYIKPAIRAIMGIVALTVQTGCNDFLDSKPDKKLVVPNKIRDYQALLDNYPVINNSDAGSGEISADDYFLTDADFNGISQEYYQRMHIWEKEAIFNATSNDWSLTYRPVFVSNTILKGLEKNNVAEKTSAGYLDVKGQALFVRARSFFQLAVLFAQAYSATTASNDMGIPIRLDDDFNERSVRASVQETYDRIIQDLKAAVPLLPINNVSVMRPKKSAAYGLLSKVYLSMGKYAEAGAYADSCLALQSELLDFNTLSKTAIYPIARLNKEVQYESMIPVPAPVSTSRAKIVMGLYNSYSDNDLRKALFFRPNDDGTYRFKGSYEGGGNLFSGIATDEVFLIRAECAVRTGAISKGLDDLNNLLRTRFMKVNGQSTYVDFQTSDRDVAIAKILLERRKELLMRGIRWWDVKRLNKDGANINFSRMVNQMNYLLPANDKRFALEIPESLIAITDILQNP